MKILNGYTIKDGCMLELLVKKLSAKYYSWSVVSWPVIACPTNVPLVGPSGKSQVEHQVNSLFKLLCLTKLLNNLKFIYIHFYFFYLRSCQRKGCNRMFHFHCAKEHRPDDFITVGGWHCVDCIKDRLQFGAGFAWGEIESILDVRHGMFLVRHSWRPSILEPVL